MNKVEKYNIKYKNLISKLFGGSNNEDEWWEQYENEDYDEYEYDDGYDPDDDMHSKIPKSFNNTTKRESRNEANIEKENYDNLINDIKKEKIFVNWHKFDYDKKKIFINKLTKISNIDDIINFDNYDHYNIKSIYLDIINKLVLKDNNFDLIGIILKKNNQFRDILLNNNFTNFNIKLAINLLKEKIININKLLSILSIKDSIDLDHQNSILESLENVKDKFKFDVFIKFFDLNKFSNPNEQSTILNNILQSIGLSGNTIELNENIYNLNIFEEFLEHKNEFLEHKNEFYIKILYMYVKFFNSNILSNILKYYD